MVASDEEKYANARADRQGKVSAVLNSLSSKKVVVAGPGTGKTFLFKEILKNKRTSLTLTFVNSLVEDLSLDLCGISEVRTLHGFARSVMARATRNVRVFPKLSRVIRNDAEILTGKKIDFDSLFHARDDNNENIPFYKRRRVYYQHYGFSDIIYAAVLYLEQKQDKIPKFDQVLIDEVQDFNKLEISLIELLASKNPILVAGDDDQSLYYFKGASPAYLRDLYNSKNEFASFNLPHCSRCTRVIVDAANDIINSAKKEGFLKGRIDKPYIYFEDEKKEIECRRYPTLAHLTCFATQVPFFVSKKIHEIAEERREKFSVLIIAPTKVRCRKIANALEEKGFENIHFVDGDKDDGLTPMDALALLAEDAKCNLGWRIAAELSVPEADFKSLLEESDKDRQKAFHDLVDADLRRGVKSLVATFKKIKRGETPAAELLTDLLEKLDIKPDIAALEMVRSKIKKSSYKTSDPATRNVSIKITTIPSSKGLAEDYVFIADFDDRFFMEKDGNCSDQKIFDFLVAITRARRKVFLMSSQQKEPKFLTWIGKDRIEKVAI